MGILDMLFGSGGGGAMGRLTGDLGSKGGLLSKFGMGKYGDLPQEGGLGGLGGGNLQDFLSQLMPQGGSQASDQSGQPQYPSQAPPSQSAGLPALIMQYLQQQRR